MWEGHWPGQLKVPCCARRGMTQGATATPRSASPRSQSAMDKVVCSHNRSHVYLCLLERHLGRHSGRQAAHRDDRKDEEQRSNGQYLVGP